MKGCLNKWIQCSVKYIFPPLEIRTYSQIWPTLFEMAMIWKEWQYLIFLKLDQWLLSMYFFWAVNRKINWILLSTNYDVVRSHFSSSSKHWLHNAQCPRTDLNKRFLPRLKTITARKLKPHSSKISTNWNPPQWVPLYRFFKNWFLLIKKSFTVITFKLILPCKKVPTV